MVIEINRSRIIFSITACCTLVLTTGIPLLVSAQSADEPPPVGGSAPVVTPESKPQESTGVIPQATIDSTRATSTTPATSTTSIPVSPQASTPETQAISATPSENTEATEIPPAPADTTPSLSSLKLGTGAALAMLLACAAYIFFKSQSKKKNSESRCHRIKDVLDQKKKELETTEGEISLQEKLLRAFEKKIGNVIEEKKNEIKGNIADAAKETVLEAIDSELLTKTVRSAETAKETHDDIKKKIEDIKKLLDTLRALQNGLHSQIKTLESAHALCVQSESMRYRAHAKGDGLELPGAGSLRAVIFDLNGVFIKSEPLSKRFEEVFHVATSEFLPALKEIMAKARLPEAGDSFLYWEPYLRTWKLNLSREQFFDFWFSGEKEVPEMTALAKELKSSGLKIFILSNNFSERTAYYEKSFPSLKEVADKIYYSWQTGFVKPDRRAYELILHENNLEPKTCAYFDDSEEYIRTATDMGINSYIFKNIDGVREILDKAISHNP